MNEWWFLSFMFGITLFACALMVYPLRRHLLVSLLLVPVIFALSFTGYYYWGDFAKWQDYLQHQESQSQAQNILNAIKSPQELVEKLLARLDETPKSAKGWYLLGRLYAGQDDRKNEVAAYAKANQLDPANEQYEVNYAHSLWQLNNRQFNAQIIGLFQHLLKNNPNQPDALSMLAIDAFVNHAYEEAIAYWQRLLNLVPAQSEEAAAIRKAIAKSEERLK